MLALLLLAAAAGSPIATDFRLNRPAPELEACRWLPVAESGDAQRTVEQRSHAAMQLSPPTPPSGRALADFAGWVVIVAHLDPTDAKGLDSELSVLYDAAIANEDRRSFVLALGAASHTEELERAWKAAALPGALGFVEGEMRYAAPELGARTCFIVGRAGELAWLGDPTKDEKGFAGALEKALARRAAPRIAPPSADVLAPALAEYYAGHFDKARALAKKLAPGKSKLDEASLAAAAELVEAVDAHERELAARVAKARGGPNVGELVELDALLKSGFKPPTADLAERAFAETAARDLMGMSKDDYVAWLELERRRPAFFPRRRDAAGVKYADELERFVRRSANSLPPTQHAQALLERFTRAR